MLHRETVSPELLDLTKKLMQDDKLQDFRLVGGTALALLFGHRTSIDIDLFTNKEFDAKSLQDHIDEKYGPSTSRSTTNSVMCRIDNIKVDMIAHRYQWLEPSLKTDGLRMASAKDISAMKIHAINQAGTRQKDFVDLYFLLEKYSLNEMVQGYGKKYPEGFPNIAKESVRSFDRVTIDDPIKVFDKEITWREVEKRLNKAVLNPNKIFKADHLNLLPKKNINPDSHKRKPKL